MAPPSNPGGKVRQVVLLSAPPEQVYAAFLESRRHSEFTGDTAKIAARVGGRFSAYGGYSVGRILALRPGKEIALTWRAEDWPEGAESKVRIRLEKTPRGTRLTFLQEGIPRGYLAEIRSGWREWYWQPLREYLRPKK